MEAGGKLFVHCREVVHSSECPLSKVPLYTRTTIIRGIAQHNSMCPRHSRTAPLFIGLTPFNNTCSFDTPTLCYK